VTSDEDVPLFWNKKKKKLALLLRRNELSHGTTERYKAPLARARSTLSTREEEEEEKEEEEE
jgi:hypothetical protein